jgi:uncharacterized membrane protein
LTTKKRIKLNSFLGRLAGTGRDERGAEAEPNLIGQNIEIILAFFSRGERKINRVQRSVERLSDLLGRPLYLVAILGFVVLWTGMSWLAPHYFNLVLDAPPFPWLQGLMSLGGLVTSTVVLIKQNRMSKLEAQRAHLDLQVNLLTEQKVTKLLVLLEELRAELLQGKRREDPELVALQQPTDAGAMLTIMEEWSATVGVETIE